MLDSPGAMRDIAPRAGAKKRETNLPEILREMEKDQQIADGL